MLPYSFRLAMRHFTKKSVYSAIIIMSLTVGFACTCLLISFLISESNADSFHTKGDRIYEVTADNPFDGSGRIVFTLAPARDFFIENFPEVENICQLAAVPGAEVNLNGDLIPLKSFSADTSFFTLFDFPLVAGSRKGLTPDGIMLTSKKAKQIFGTEDVIGKLVDFQTKDTTKTLSVTGVIGEFPEKSHLSFDAVISHSVFPAKESNNRPGGACYLLLRDQANSAELVSKINSDSTRPGFTGRGKQLYGLDPLQRAYFNESNTMPYMQRRSETFVTVGWVVCGLILFMASFNFVNLFLLSMQERKKEAGIMKTLGISTWQTVRSASTEACIYIGTSLILSLMVAYSILPIFNSSLETTMSFNYLSRWQVISSIGSLVIILAAIVVVIATFQQLRVLPVSMMKNMTAKVRYSKMFFTLQFFVSITLCVCSIAIIKQMKFIESEPLGFNRNIIQLNTPGKKSIKLLETLKISLLDIQGIDNVALSEGNPISGNTAILYTLDNGEKFTPFIFQGDLDFVKTLHLNVLEGTSDLKNENEVMVNETLVKKFDIQNPVGTIVPGTKQTIAGVVKDFTCVSFKQQIPPVIISRKDQSKSVLIDFGHNDIDELLPMIKTAWSKILPDDYFDYRIIQQDLMKKYSEETLFYKVVLSSSITSMVISCFGLFALSWAVIKSRSKEMGIRKVMGASVSNILGLLTVSFAKRLVLAFVLAAPAGYYLMNLWLSRFVYKAPLDSWVFVITGVALAAIAVVTLGVQTLRASLSSPLEEIRE